jgi:hypothetical protein
MNKVEMAEALTPTIAEVREFARRCTSLAEILEKTCRVEDADGTNLSAMTQLRSILEHPWILTSKARPSFNAAYSALWKNAKAKVDAATREANKHLASFAPKKCGRKNKEET